MAKVVCVLYDDPVDGYPKSYARDDLPKLDRYPGGQTLPTPKAIDFKPGALLGSVSGELGLRKFLEGAGHTLVVTSDKDGPNSVLERELADAEIVISQPFWPAYLTARAHRQGAEAEARHHRRHRLRPRRPAGRDGARHHRRRGDLLQLDQRRRARGDDDPRPRAQLHPVLPVGGEGRLEHRRLRRRALRPRGHACRHGRRRPHRPRRAAPAEAVRREAPLHRPPPAAGGGREGARPHLPRDRRRDGAVLRRRHDQRAAASGDRASLRRRDDREDEARRLSGQHRARQDLRTATPSPARWRAASSPAMPATSGSRSRRRRIIRGGRCRITA